MGWLCLVALAAGPGFTQAVFDADRVVSLSASGPVQLYPPAVEGDAPPSFPKTSCAGKPALLLLKGDALAGGWSKPDAKLVAAVQEARLWREERMRAVGESELWKAPRAALASDNPFLRKLAAAFLDAHGAANVVDALWGQKGTAARKKNESRAAEPKPMDCK